MPEGLSLETHVGNSIALLCAAIAISFVLFRFYKEGAYTRTGLIVGQLGLWLATVFMLYTLN